MLQTMAGEARGKIKSRGEGQGWGEESRRKSGSAKGKSRWRDGKEGEDGRRADAIVKVEGRGLDRDE